MVHRALQTSLRVGLRRPLLLASLVGLVVAWPIHSTAVALHAVGVVVLAVLLALGGELRARGPRQGNGLIGVGLGGLVLSSLLQRPDEPMLGFVLLVATALVMVHARRLPPGQRRSTPALMGVASLLSLLAVLVPEEVGLPRGLAVVALLAVGGGSLLTMARRSAARAPDLLSLLLASPAELLVISFAVLGSVGTLLLMLPASSTAQGSLHLADAVFTAVSASCVTGLAVVDTQTDLSGLGQLVVLGLIQVGGLGIMTFAAAASIFLGRRLKVQEEILAAEMIGGQSVRRDLRHALRTVLGVTAVSELLGAGALTALFASGGDSWGMALWRGSFTSISAFCNAGFALQSDSLMSYQSQPLVLLVVGALILVGGLGPLVVVALPGLRRGRGSMHLRLVVVTTLVFVLVPWLAILVLEWSHAMAGLGFVDKLVNALFQSVTLRTAGFNSVDFTSLRGATWTLMLLAMFVGGSPGSTAGGVKTTTFAVLVLALVATIRGRVEVEAFGRRLCHRNVYEAAAIATMGVLSTLGVLVALQLTQRLPLEAAIFEVVSALGTVGLSMGATGQLDDFGKLVIVAAMFAGRVGPLTLFIFLLGRQRPTRRFPLEAVQVG